MREDSLDGVRTFLAALDEQPHRSVIGHIATARPKGRAPVHLYESHLRSMTGTVGTFLPDPPRGLSARLFWVLELVAEGHTNVEIAGKLHYHESTANADVRFLFDAFGASGRVHLITMAVLRGVLIPSRDGKRLIAPGRG